jgi:guanosine-3',5'-bis(diphosphate) 3'-pyrophosphohydrolase
VRNTKVIAAALLHDTIEDTETTEAELTEVFGKSVAAIVAEVTDNKQLPKAIRKRLQVDHAPHLSRRAQLVKLADKICNLQDILATPPVGWSEERKRRYFDWAKDVVDGTRGANAELEGRFDVLHRRRLGRRTAGARSQRVVGSSPTPRRSPNRQK